MNAKFRIHELELPAAAAGTRFDLALAAALPQYSRSRLQRWDQQRCGPARWPRGASAERLAGGERVRVEAEFRPRRPLRPRRSGCASPMR